ncbi:hypothetical protein MRX96_025330 [Rhipicephalus microplus]
MEILVTPAEDAPMVVTPLHRKLRVRQTSQISRMSSDFPRNPAAPHLHSRSCEHVRCQPVLQTLNVMHNIVVFVVLVLGHVLQYTACFRRDGIISYRSQAVGSANNEFVHAKGMTCGSSSFAVYVLPAMMQMAAYVIALMHTRSHENEQFQSLVEKVFLQLTPTDVWNVAKKRITRRLHAVYAAGVLWIVASLSSQVLNICAGGTLKLKWMHVAGRRPGSALFPARGSRRDAPLPRRRQHDLSDELRHPLPAAARLPAEHISGRAREEDHLPGVLPRRRGGAQERPLPQPETGPRGDGCKPSG